MLDETPVTARAPTYGRAAGSTLAVAQLARKEPQGDAATKGCDAAAPVRMGQEMLWISIDHDDKAWINHWKCYRLILFNHIHILMIYNLHNQYIHIIMYEHNTILMMNMDKPSVNEGGNSQPSTQYITGGL